MTLPVSVLFRPETEPFSLLCHGFDSHQRPSHRCLSRFNGHEFALRIFGHKQSSTLVSHNRLARRGVLYSGCCVPVTSVPSCCWMPCWHRSYSTLANSTLANATLANSTLAKNSCSSCSLDFSQFEFGQFDFGQFDFGQFDFGQTLVQAVLCVCGVCGVCGVCVCGVCGVCVCVWCVCVCVWCVCDV